jgi:lipopolysaccharide transport system ATP-binding protein
MSDIAVKVEALGKRYRIGQREPYGALRDVVMNTLRGHRRAATETIWALKDVSFDVQQGEVVGIIGRNGAGKSTLLKILSRVTKPTEGMANIWGRVGSLLEVGTGFHPELTGRENIYLNGAILGMRRAEIDRKFDEIVTFAETEQFLDTPVKHYSSGMRVRLAFAVAAHLEPEILLIDEILAVGDAAFQKKCLGKMGDVVKEGRTILFVSHNTSALLNLCHRGVLLDHGRVIAQDAIEPVVRKYLAGLRAAASMDLRTQTHRRGRGRVKFTQVRFENGAGRALSQGVSGQPLVIVLEYESASAATERLQNCRVSLAFRDSLGQVLFNCSSELTSREFATMPATGRVRCVIPRLPLTQSEYFLSPFLEVNHEIEDWLQETVVLSVADGDFFGTGKLYPDGWRGKGVLVPHEWQVG